MSLVKYKTVSQRHKHNALCALLYRQLHTCACVKLTIARKREDSAWRNEWWNGPFLGFFHPRTAEQSCKETVSGREKDAFVEENSVSASFFSLHGSEHAVFVCKCVYCCCYCCCACVCSCVFVLIMCTLNYVQVCLCVCVGLCVVFAITVVYVCVFHSLLLFMCAFLFLHVCLCCGGVCMRKYVCAHVMCECWWSAEKSSIDSSSLLCSVVLQFPSDLRKALWCGN